MSTYTFDAERSFPETGRDGAIAWCEQAVVDGGWYAACSCGWDEGRFTFALNAQLRRTRHLDAEHGGAL